MSNKSFKLSRKVFTIAFTLSIKTNGKLISAIVLSTNKSALAITLVIAPLASLNLSFKSAKASLGIGIFSIAAPILLTAFPNGSMLSEVTSCNSLVNEAVVNSSRLFFINLIYDFISVFSTGYFRSIVSHTVTLTLDWLSVLWSTCIDIGCTVNFP